MAINVEINEPEQTPGQTMMDPPPPPPPPKPQAKLSMNIRKTMDGNLMIFDHEELDIVVMPAKSKIVAFAKDLMSDSTYAAQDRLFYELIKKGVIVPESVHGGNVYGSMEARIMVPANPNIDPTQVVVFTIGRFIEEEAPYFSLFKEKEKEDVEALTDPSDEDSTELGEVPHLEKKGSLRPGWIRGPYGMTSHYRY